jgi:hypothetical protein
VSADLEQGTFGKESAWEVAREREGTVKMYVICSVLRG